MSDKQDTPATCQTDCDRLEEIRMALACDLPESNPYPGGTIEHGIYALRKRAGDTPQPARDDGGAACSADDYEELKSFVRRITLALQKNRSVKSAEWDRWFQEAYRLYVKHNVEAARKAAP